MRIKALFLAACMLLICGLTGCGTNEDTKEMGRFAEKRLIELSGANSLGISSNENGNLVLYTYDDESVSRRTITLDGEVLESVKIDWMNDLIRSGGSPFSVSEGADGTVYFLYTNAEGENALASSADGTVKNIEIEGWNQASEMSGNTSGADELVFDSELEEGKASSVYGGSVSIEGDDSGLYPLSVCTLESGEFLIIYSGAGIHRYSSDGEKLREYGAGLYFAAYAVGGGKLAVSEFMGGGIIVYDLESGEEIKSYPYSSDSFNLSLAIEGDDVYVADSNGIHRLTDSGKETVIEGGLTSLMVPTYQTDGFLVLGSSQFLLALSDDDGMYLAKNYFDETLPSEPDKVLNIFSLYDNNTIRQAIGEFQRMNPDVLVNLNIALTDDSGVTAEDAIRKLNTELISGNGPDLIVLDGLPFQSYIEKGFLKDISELASLLLESGEYFDNILGAYSSGDKIYAVPARFTLPVMFGSGETLDNISSLSALADLLEEGQGSDPMVLVAPDELWSDEGIMMKYYDACAGSFINSDGSINEEALTEYLQGMQRIDAALKESSPKSGEDLVMIAFGGSAGFETLDTGSWKVRDGSALAHIQQLSGIMGLLNIGSDLGEIKGMELRSLFEQGLFYPVAGIGISNTCQEAEAAQQFIELLLSEKIQNKYLFDGFPINSQALSVMIDDNLTNLWGQEPVSDMNFENLCESLKTPVFIDEVIKNAVAQQFPSLADGGIEPEQAAKNIISGTRIYLAEGR